MNNEEKNKIVKDIVSYEMQVNPTWFNERYKSGNDAIAFIKEKLDDYIQFYIKSFEHDVVYTKPEILDNWTKYFTCPSPIELVNELKEYAQSKNRSSESLDIEGKGKEIKLMDIACRHLNDEDLTFWWLEEGVPDDTQDIEYTEFAKEGYYDEYKELFIKIMKKASENKPALFDCPEEAFDYAKTLVPEITNSNELGECLQEECTQAGSIQGPVSSFGIHKKRDESFEDELQKAKKDSIEKGLYTESDAEHTSSSNHINIADNIIEYSDVDDLCNVLTPIINAYISMGSQDVFDILQSDYDKSLLAERPDSPCISIVIVSDTDSPAWYATQERYIEIENEQDALQIVDLILKLCKEDEIDLQEFYDQIDL